MSPDGNDGASETGVESDEPTRRRSSTGDERGGGVTGLDGEVIDRASRVLEHPAIVAIGFLAVAVGLLAAIGLRVAPDLPTRAVATAVAVGAVVGAAVLAARRLSTTVDQATTPAVEYRGDVTVPGSAFDGTLATAASGAHNARLKARRQVVERLRGVTAAAHAAVTGGSAETARDGIVSANLPDSDAVFAPGSSDGPGNAGEVNAADLVSFLSGDDVSDSVPDQVRTAVGGRSVVGRRADRVVAALGGALPGVRFDADRPDRRGLDVRRGTDVVELADTTDADRRGADRRTGRWTGLSGLVLLAVGVGTLTGLGSVPPSLLVAAAVLVGAAGTVALSSPPPLTLAVERSLETARPEPGEEFTVTVTVTNTGPDLIPDLRVVDGVPPGLQVADGSPRYATALGGGESLSFEYDVAATRGTHSFDPAQVVVRGLSGAIERERHVESEAPTDVECVFELGANASVPVHPGSARRVGRVLTDTGGSGVELHSVREYRRGDPLARIDWNRVATSGEFATLQFREEHAATVVVLVDARAESYVASRVDAPAAPELSLDAADVLVSSLLSSGDSVGLAALSPEWCWLEPRGGDAQRARARRLMATHSAFDAGRPEDAFYGTLAQRRLLRELPADAQLVLLSPLCDDRAMRIAREFHARDYPVTVVSPDATGERTGGQRLAAVERAIRLSRLRRTGIRVVDWDPDESLGTAVEAAERRWSA